jgi:acetyl-CoA carboxylase carboxyl transferase subunit beta
MAWLKKTDVKSKISGKLKLDIWTRCTACQGHIYKQEWEKNLKVCPKCNYHGRITCTERLDLLIDPGSFEELYSGIIPRDTLNFKDEKGSYGNKIKETISKTGLNEAVITGYGKINNRKVALAIMDFRFLGGSLGSGTGEKIFQTAMAAVEHNLPYIIVSASGGARMQEGMLSLMQMAKTCTGIAQLRKKNLPYLSVLTDPTSGGVSASYAMMGDVNIAEPGALIAFAGRRVIEQTIRQKLPDNFQTAEYLLEQGFIDIIVNRKDMKDLIGKILDFNQRK